MAWRDVLPYGIMGFELTATVRHFDYFGTGDHSDDTLASSRIGIDETHGGGHEVAEFGEQDH